MSTLAILRPEPGNSKTAQAARRRGFGVLQLPLFECVALDWVVPEVSVHDGLLLTSANALRWGGAGLAEMRALPVVAVGAATAKAAVDAGFDVMIVGDADAQGLLAQAGGQFSRLLHLGGADTSIITEGVAVHPAITRSIAVYAARATSVSLDAAQKLRGTTALLHSPRAARALRAVLAGADIPPAALCIACFSPTVRAVAEAGWRDCATAATPTDAALLDAAATLARLTGCIGAGISNV